MVVVTNLAELCPDGVRKPGLAIRSDLSEEQEATTPLEVVVVDLTETYSYLSLDGLTADDSSGSPM